MGGKSQFARILGPSSPAWQTLLGTREMVYMCCRCILWNGCVSNIWNRFLLDIAVCFPNQGCLPCKAAHLKGCVCQHVQLLALANLAIRFVGQLEKLLNALVDSSFSTCAPRSCCNAILVILATSEGKLIDTAYKSWEEGFFWLDRVFAACPITL